MGRPRVREIFLSHSHRDRKRVARLVEFLAEQGLRSWCAPHELRGAQVWHDKIGEALERCDWFAVFLTPSAVSSPWVKRELLYAVNQPRLTERLVPILATDCSYSRLSWTLDSLQLVDLRADTPKARARLLETFGRSGRGRK